MRILLEMQNLWPHTTPIRSEPTFLTRSFKRLINIPKFVRPWCRSYIKVVPMRNKARERLAFHCYISLWGRAGLRLLDPLLTIFQPVLLSRNADKDVSAGWGWLLAKGQVQAVPKSWLNIKYTSNCGQWTRHASSSLPISASSSCSFFCLLRALIVHLW